ncbi:hypothetical protein [Bacillus sp. JCM 19041]|uniref:hypothetical protein n=1 Tax=Bacillus sp. JCM 19041 TaxID=1460637 RepID=UPI0006D012CF
MIYLIEYEHLIDDLVTDSETRWIFNKVKSTANKFKIELSDVDFRRFIELEKNDHDTKWIMHQMSLSNGSFIDALMSYVLAIRPHP